MGKNRPLSLFATNGKVRTIQLILLVIILAAESNIFFTHFSVGQKTVKNAYSPTAAWPRSIFIVPYRLGFTVGYHGKVWVLLALSTLRAPRGDLNPKNARFNAAGGHCVELFALHLTA